MHAVHSVYFLVVVPVVAGSLSPVPELGFVLQLVAVGTAVGSVVALRARARSPEADAWRITTAWSLVGLVIGAVTALLAALV